MDRKTNRFQKPELESTVRTKTLTKDILKV